MIKDLIRNLRVAVLNLLYRFRPALSLMDKTVIIAPHPDDEVIGCAGLIQALVERDTPPHVIILTGGEGSHRGCCDIAAEDLIAGRHNLTMKAAETMGLPMANVHCLQYPDGGVALEHPETERLAALLKELKPDAVFVPHRGEGWSDHLKAAEIVKALIGMFNENENEDSKQERSASLNSKPEIYEYCVWMWYYNVWHLDRKQACVFRMSRAQHQRKLRAMEQYVTPLAPCGKPWSGVLPKPFLEAAEWNRELYFKIR